MLPPSRVYVRRNRTLELPNALYRCCHADIKGYVIRDGNRYPRSDNRWVFTPLEYVCWLNILPVGLLLGKNIHPMGKRVLERYTFTHTR
jgi:hypothetical protein